MNFTVKKLFVLLLIPLPVWCMDKELQTKDIPVVSSLKLQPFTCNITPKQREVIENVLRHKEEYADACCRCNSALAAASCVSLLSWVAILSLAVVDVAYYDGKMSETPFLCLVGSLVMPWPLLIAHNGIRMARASNVYQGYLKQGKECGLGQHAGSIIELLDNGYKNQKLCDGTCSACNTKRGLCGYCRQLYNAPDGWLAREKTVCNNCWQSMCSRCTVCKKSRKSKRKKLLVNELGLSSYSLTCDFKGLQRFLQAIMKKQSEDAQSAV